MLLDDNTTSFGATLSKLRLITLDPLIDIPETVSFSPHPYR